MKLVLRLRTEAAHGGLVTAWLLSGKGVTTCLMHGVMPASEAEKLAEALTGVAKVERSVCNDVRMDEPRPETVMERQGELFLQEGSEP